MTSTAGTMVTFAHTILLRIAQLLMAVAVLLLALMAVLVVLQVVARNGFDLGLPWADELARFSGVALVYLALPLLAVRSQHVAVDMLPQFLGGRSRRVMAVVAEAGVFVFCAITLYGMQAYLMRAGKFATPAMGLSNWIFYAPAVVGITLLGLVALVRLLCLAGGGVANQSPAGGPQ
ncbi:TRAP transporter small permease [Rhizobium halophytocola]|uniref:TRAP transporter small permease protein n=1 Tax=Rhizobium halophytocola TaxID=735519 RepID=A0ABS4DUE7_9HYPH|nr:TRAP transporter small permease subunit [Rhizobium halophytocola]MBP1849321.1 C4-dicarboxylate transporter DctQ subunit [Rhizobium halophytocola]